jgi:hypothetical protein
LSGVQFVWETVVLLGVSIRMASLLAHRPSTIDNPRSHLIRVHSCSFAF